ncbi:hypothetical protein SAMN05518672_106183 [Chitinophaga sp. CF118]|nr:hypothetical protein SAMN05518672_106183 [Chitinophaga sp. CF118]
MIKVIPRRNKSSRLIQMLNSKKYPAHIQVIEYEIYNNLSRKKV